MLGKDNEVPNRRGSQQLGVGGHNTSLYLTSHRVLNNFEVQSRYALDRIASEWVQKA